MLYLRTVKMDKLLAKKVDHYRSIWEHEWKHLLKVDTALKSKVQEMKSTIYMPENHRVCFFGGRTDLYRFLWQAKDHPNEYGIYRDIRYFALFLNISSNMQETCE